MAYRKVGYLEQCFYALRWILKHGVPKKYPKIKAIFVDGAKRRDWTYNRTTGEIEFETPVPEGADMKIIFRMRGWKQKKERGDGIDSQRAEQAVLHTEADTKRH